MKGKQTNKQTNKPRKAKKKFVVIKGLLFHQHTNEKDNSRVTRIISEPNAFATSTSEFKIYKVVGIKWIQT